MELLDIYNEKGEKTGKVINRYADKILEGEYVRAVGALIINSNKKILISKRSMSKPSFPGYWELSGGAVQTGEDSLNAIIREIKEEVGINLNANEGVFIKTAKTKTLIKDLWAFKFDIEIKDLKFEDGEVSESKWVDIDTMIKLRENGEMIESNMVTKEDFKKCIELLNME